MTGRRRVLAFAALLAGAVGCDQRNEPRIVGINRPAIEVQSGNFTLVAVDDVPLPRADTNGGTIYRLVSGGFELHSDSTWIFSTVETLTGVNGVFIGTSPANYQGTWKVTDSTITLAPSYGTMKVKADSLFWRGGPKHTFQDTLKFTLVRK